MNYSIFKSRAFWSLVLTFVVNGYAAITGKVPANVDLIVSGLLSALTLYFHINPSQSYNPPA